MGGVATALTVALGLPANLPASWVLDLAEGFEAECALVGAHVVGGDVTAADQIVIAVTAMGDAAHPVHRDGAAPGDVVAFAGVLGLAGAGFAALSRGFRSPKAAVDAHRVPHPPYAAGPQAADAGATAMVDVSDGLLADVGHIAVASGVVIDLETAAFTIPEGVSTVADALGVDPLRFVLSGGDDYALVATFSSATDLPDGWTKIGSVLGDTVRRRTTRPAARTRRRCDRTTAPAYRPPEGTVRLETRDVPGSARTGGRPRARRRPRAACARRRAGPRSGRRSAGRPTCCRGGARPRARRRRCSAA